VRRGRGRRGGFAAEGCGARREAGGEGFQEAGEPEEEGGGGGGGGGGSASTGATPPNGALKLPKLLPEQQQQQTPIRPDETTTTTTTTKESIAAKLATELRRLADRISYEVDKRECGYGFFDLKRPSDDVNVLLDALNAVEGRYKDIGRDA
jgi:hypothetical protein